MIKHDNILINDEWEIKRWRQGVKLVKPSTSCHDFLSNSVSTIMKLPVNVYFMDTDSCMRTLNEQTAKTCGYTSSLNAIGKSIRDVSKKETAQRIIKNDREIISNRVNKITTETYTRLDDIDLTAISIKFPWYQNDDVIGIMGCSILVDQQNIASLSDALRKLMQTGLLMPSQASSTSIPGLIIDDVFFDERDQQILYLTVRGKTAKNIARIIDISHRTVEHRIEKIKLKLSVATRSELIDKVIDYFLSNR